jgi:hypothetical protein
MGRDATDIALSAKEVSDGYIICGEVNMMSDAVKSNGVLVKLDKNGKTIWYKEYGGNNNDGFQAMLVTKDNGFVCAGYTNSYGAGRKDMYLVRTDSAGSELWHKTFGDIGTDYATSIAQTKDGYIIAGTFTWSATGKTDVYLVKTDANGDTKQK